MPNVTIDATEYERKDLTSAPPDGFVMLRPLPYAMVLTRRDKALKMRMIQQRPQGQRKGSTPPQQEEQVIDLETLSMWSAMFDYTYCLGEHNLTNKDGTPLDFTNAKTIEMVFNSLNPKVGAEITKYIDELNNDEDEELAEDFLRRRNSLSETSTPTSLTVTEDGPKQTVLNQ